MIRVAFVLPMLLLFVPGVGAEGCDEQNPCVIAMQTTQDSGLYFGGPGTTTYNVTQGDWHVLDVFSDHDARHTITLEHYGVSVETVCFSCGPPGPPSARSAKFLASDPGSFSITDEQTGESVTLLVAANDVTDIEAGAPPITTSTTPSHSATGNPTDDNTREVPGLGAVALIGVLSLALLRPR